MSRPTISVAIDLDAADLAERISFDDAVEFIKQLDAAIGEWDITLRLADHFDKLRAEHAKEQAEDAAKRVAP